MLRHNSEDVSGETLGSDRGGAGPMPGSCKLAVVDIHTNSWILPDTSAQKCFRATNLKFNASCSCEFVLRHNLEDVSGETLGSDRTACELVVCKPVFCAYAGLLSANVSGEIVFSFVT